MPDPADLPGRLDSVLDVLYLIFNESYAATSGDHMIRDEVAAEALGVNTTAYKVLAFVIGSFFAGVAGGLFAHYLSYLNPNSFTFLKRIEVIAMVGLGGMGSVSGAELAAILRTGRKATSNAEKA